jgi:hypothetical protein
MAAVADRLQANWDRAACRPLDPPGLATLHVVTRMLSLPPILAPAPDPDSPLERASRRLGSVIEERLLLNRSGGLVLAI